MIPKFRAWLKKENRMINVTFLDFLLEEVCEEVLLFDNYEFKNIELMQSTGLKDKNGKEIFEGDIVRILYDRDNEYGVVKRKGIVQYNEEKALYKIKIIDELFASDILGNTISIETLSCYATFEIIGNIYENPKLLKENK